MNTIEIAVIPGDGVGAEVVPEGLKILTAAAKLHGGVRFAFTQFPWGCGYYQECGRMMAEDAIGVLGGFEAIVFGSVGSESVPDEISLWGLLMPIRQEFQQYVNLRPVRLLRGVESPLHGRVAGDIDFVVVRENTEGEYANIGGRIHDRTPQAAACQVNYFSRFGIERVARYAFALANARSHRVTVATKSNGIVHSMPFWDEVVRGMNQEYSDVYCEWSLIDALCAQFVSRPEWFDVVLASNLFGDILTDIGAAVVGGVGMAPSANLNPEREYPSMFEPVHGSAFDIAGKGIANPLGQIWTSKLLLDFFDLSEVAERVIWAMEETLLSGMKTVDLGGMASTAEMGDAVCKRLLLD